MKGLHSHVFQFVSQRPVYRHVAVIKTLQYRLNIQSRSSTQNRLFSQLSNPAQRLVKILTVLADMIGIARLPDIDKEVRNPAVITEVLSGADVHPPVHLPGIGTDNYAVELPGHVYGQPGFSRGRRPKNNDEIRLGLRV